MTIEKTMEELGDDVKSWKENSTATGTTVDDEQLNPYDLVCEYDYYCHYTHFSPLFSQDKRKMIGLPSSQDIEELIRKICPLIHVFLFVADKHSAFKDFKIEEHITLLNKLYGRNSEN